MKNFIQKLIGDFAPTVFKPLPTGLLYLLLQAVEREIAGECPWTTGEECLQGYTDTFWTDLIVGGPKCRNISCPGYRHPWGLIGYTSRSATSSSVDNRFDYSSFRYGAGNGSDWVAVGTLGVMLKFDFGLTSNPGGYGAYLYGFSNYGYNGISVGSRNVYIGDKWTISCVAATGVVGPAVPDPANRGSYGAITTNTKGVAGPAVIDVIGTTGTYHRITGSFLLDRFVVGDKITVTGYATANDNGVKYIGSVTALDIVVTDNMGMIDEAGTGDERIVADGAYTGDHDTTYTVEIIDFWGYVQNFNNALLQISLATSTDTWLDFWGEYFGIARSLVTTGITKIYEDDETYRARIMKEITRAKGTRAILLEEAKNYFKSDLVTIEEYHQTGARSIVVGTDGLYYKCKVGHTADPTTRPITGANWDTKWTQGGLAGCSWVDGFPYITGIGLQTWDGPVLPTPPGDPAKGLWPWQFYINAPVGRSPSVKYVKDGSGLLAPVNAYTYSYGYGYAYGSFIPVVYGTPLFSVPVAGDALLFGNNTQFSGIKFTFSVPGIGGSYTWQYWNGSGWSNLTINDTTAGLTTSGFVHWLEGLTTWDKALDIPYNVPPRSVVVGTDTFTYQCILSHTAAPSNKPITGANWATYWSLGGAYPTSWVNGLSYIDGTKLFWVRCLVVTPPGVVPVASNLALTYAGQTCRGCYVGQGESIVLGSNGLNYKCILSHISDASTKPIIGGSWATYWSMCTWPGVIWTDVTSYVKGTYPDPLTTPSRDKNNCYIYSELSYAKPNIDEAFQNIIDRLKVAGTAAIVNPV